MEFRHDFLICLVDLVLEVFYKLLQLFDYFNVFSSGNVNITEWRFRNDGVFLFFKHVTTPGGILIFYGDTPGGMFLCS